MATMTIRTTVAFDPGTVARLERLARRWGVSKSETLRRALQLAEEAAASGGTAEPDFSRMTPLQLMDWLQRNPQVEAGWGDDHRRQLREDRDVDAEIEDARERERSRSMVAENPGSMLA
jgi:predicted transcriptional regulator